MALWVAQGLLAVGFATSGAMKLISSREQLKAKGLAWVDDFSDRTVTLIGITELLGATGLLLPPLLDIAPWLASVAAIGLATLMGLAVLTHIRRKETAGVVVALVLAGIAIFIAWGRLGPQQF
jgi:DoxX-like family